MPKGKIEKVIGLMKDELGGQSIKEFVRLRGKTYSYLKDNNEEDKKAKGTRSVSQKENLHCKFMKIVYKQHNLTIK